MSYTLWCPEQDGTQHLPCTAYPVDPAKGFWDHIPTEAEQLELLNRLLPGEPGTTERQNALYGLSQDKFTPTNCHFDKVDPDNLRANWIDHWHPSMNGKYTNIHGWGGSTEHYPMIKQLYRCSTHRVAPKAVTLRYASKREREWHDIMNAKFRHIRRPRTDEELTQVMGIPTLATDPNIGWYAKNISVWVLNRPEPLTTHDLW